MIWRDRSLRVGRERRRKMRQSEKEGGKPFSLEPRVSRALNAELKRIRKTNELEVRY